MPNNRMLIAEDDESLREALAAMFEQAGFHVTAVGDGHALARWLAWGRPWRLVICDDRMPHVRGLRVLEAARDAGCASVAVLITGYNSYDVARRAREANVPVLTKPFDVDDLQRIIDATLAREGVVLACASCGSVENIRSSVGDDVFFCAECRGRASSPGDDPCVDLGGEG